jgi:hypothetical protein
VFTEGCDKPYHYHCQLPTCPPQHSSSFLPQSWELFITRPLSLIRPAWDPYCRSPEGSTRGSPLELKPILPAATRGHSLTCRVVAELQGRPCLQSKVTFTRRSQPTRSHSTTMPRPPHPPCTYCRGVVHSIHTHTHTHTHTHSLYLTGRQVARSSGKCLC